MKDLINQLKANSKLLLTTLFLFFSFLSFGQFKTPVVNGSVSFGEYGSTTNGTNQISSNGSTVYLTWDANNLYVAITGTSVDWPFIMYVDRDNLSPINSGTTSNGLDYGILFDNTNFSKLPFRADMAIYARTGVFNYYNNNGGVWSSPLTAGMTQANNGLNSSGGVRELSVPWTAMGGFPTQGFNFFIYSVAGIGGPTVTRTFPSANATGPIGTSARYERNFTVTNPANGSSTYPFSRDCFVFNNSSDETNFNAINIFDFTMNTPGSTITRNSTAGGDWTINGTLNIGAGTIDFGASPGLSFGGTTTNNLNISGGNLNLNNSNTSLAVKGDVVMSNGSFSLSGGGGGDLFLFGNFTKNGGTFNCNSRRVTFCGSATQSWNNTTNDNIDYLTVSNTSADVTIASNLKVGASSTNSLYIVSGGVLAVANNATLTINNNAYGSFDGTLKNNGANIIIPNLNPNTASIHVSSTGTYMHNMDAGTIPYLTWDAGSTCLMSGWKNSTSPPGGLNQSFYNFTWNSAGQQNVTENFSGNLQNIQGDFKIISTGLGAISLTDNNSLILNINKNFNQSGGVLYISNGTAVPLVHVYTDFTQSSGTLDFNPNKISGSTITVAGNFSRPGGVLTHSGAGGTGSNGIIAFTNNALQYISTANASNYVDYDVRNNSLALLTTNFPVTNGKFNVTTGTLTYQPGSTLTLGAPLHIYANGILDFKNNSQNFTVTGDVTTESGGQIILSTAGGGNLVLQGNWGNLGTFTANSGAVIFNNTTQDQFFYAEVPTTFYILNIDNGSVKTHFGTTGSGNKISSITNALNVKSGVLDLNHQNLVIKSTSSTTAAIQTIAAGSSIINADNVTVERYFPAHRTWRLVSVPVTSSSQTINSAWQEGQTNVDASHLSDNVPGYGITISGKQPGLGFDPTPQNKPSLLTYDNLNDKWNSVPNTNVAKITSNNAYMVFVRGSRLATFNQFAITSPTTLRTNGSIRQGDQLYNINTASNIFTLIGNPYPCAIDFHAILKSAGLGDKLTIIDPNVAGTYGVGAFVTFTYDNTSGNYLPSVSSSIYAPIISSGQAFLIQGSGNPETITISEQHKVPGGGSLSVFTNKEEKGQHLRINLSIKNADNSYTLEDGTLAVYGDVYSNGMDNTDALKVNNIRENVALIRDNNFLAIEARKPITKNDTLFLNIKAYTAGYNLTIIPQNLVAHGRTAVLQDSYTKSETVVSLTDTTTYSFSITSDVASQTTDRFRIVFKQLEYFPVTFNSLNATKLIDLIRVQWKIESKQNIKEYEVMRSSDGITFNSIATIPARVSSTIYYHLDKDPITGTNYYKIKCKDINGEITYSNVVKVDYIRDNQEVTVFPNPVLNGDLNILFKKLEKGIYQIVLTNSAGQIVTRRIIQNSKEGNGIITIHQKSNPGKYRLDIKTPHNSLIQTGVLY